MKVEEVIVFSTLSVWTEFSSKSVLHSVLQKTASRGYFEGPRVYSLEILK